MAKQVIRPPPSNEAAPSEADGLAAILLQAEAATETNRLLRLLLLGHHARPEAIDREGRCGVDICKVCGGKR